MRAMSRIGLTMGPICVLTVPGRRTGKPRSTPVSPLTVSGLRYVVAGLSDSDWARNVRAAGHAQLSRGRRRELVVLTEITDSQLKEEVMRAYPREVPKGAPMFVRAGVASSTDPDAFAAASNHVAVFEIRPVTPAPQSHPSTGAPGLPSSYAWQEASDRRGHRDRPSRIARRARARR
jgi:deazaflavin-dependent oxidoreductase (nitroreductase family)